MGFKVKLVDNKIFKNAFESLSVIVDEIHINVDSEGIRCSALDRSHITFCNLELSASLFDEFTCETPEELHVDTNELMNILKRLNSNDVLCIGADEGNLILHFYGEATRRFRTRLIDGEYDSPVPPKIPVVNEIEASSTLIKDAINDVSLYSERLEFSVDEDYLIIKSGDDFGDVEIKYLHGANVSEYCKSSFSVDKVKEILKSSKFSPIIKMGLGSDIPALFEFNLPTGDGKLSFMLAPRLSEED